MTVTSEFEYMYALERFGIKPGLGVMKQIMELLGHPERQFKSIHVTGTNGKGSTCAMIESVLRTAGYKTALYTSPHLYVFNERIRVGGVAISDEVLVSLVAEIRELVERAGIQPTFFEFTTALAFLYFARSHIDIAVIEVGMGGRYDATNVITPLVCVITNIGLDHTEYLGPTTAHVAREKAGIIKHNIPVFTAETKEDILAIFDAEATQQDTHVVRVRGVVQTKVLSSSFEGQDIEVHTDEVYVVRLPLLGEHQVMNMETAIAALLSIHKHGFSVSQEVMMRGIEHTIWEGRLQIVSQHPLVIVDGAHNPDGARALARFLQTIPSREVIVFAAKKKKDISEMLESVVLLFNHVIVTEGSFMPEDADVLATQIRNLGKNVEVIPNVGAATTKAIAYAGTEGTCLIAGSLYMIPEALASLK